MLWKFVVDRPACNCFHLPSIFTTTKKYLHRRWFHCSSGFTKKLDILPSCSSLAPWLDAPTSPAIPSWTERTIKVEHNTGFHLFWWGNTPESLLGFPGPGVGLALEGLYKSCNKGGFRKSSGMVIYQRCRARQGRHRNGAGRAEEQVGAGTGIESKVLIWSRSGQTSQQILALSSIGSSKANSNSQNC